MLVTMGCTYYNWVNKGCPIVTFLEQGQDKGDGSRSKKDDDQLILELFQYKFPDWRRWIFR